MKAALRHALTIAKKDLRSELRSPSAIITMILLGFLVILVFSFSLEPGSAESASARSGVLWAAFLFPGLMAVGRPFEGEREAQCLEGLLLCPVDRSAIYLGKLIASFVLSLATGFLVLVFFVVLYDVGSGQVWLALLGVMVLAALGLSAIGALAAALTAGVRARGALLTVLVLPLLVPLVIGAARCSVMLLGDDPWNGIGLWPAFMALYDVLFTAMGFVLFDYAVEG
jgi:heme exporter protein B